MPRAARPKPGPIGREVAARLREEMARQRLTGVSYSARVPISNSQVNRYLNAERNMTLDDFIALASALGIDADRLLREAIDHTPREGDQLEDADPRRGEHADACAVN